MILSHHGCRPKISETAFVSPSADIIGEVEIGDQSSIWFQVVIRGDVHWIKIGARSNIQDHSMLHVTRKKHSLTVGNDVTVGHRVMLHGCRIGDRCLIGMSSTIMDGAEIGEDSMVAAGSLVTQGRVFAPGSLILGSPARVIRPLNEDEKSYLQKSAANYVQDGKDYRTELTRRS